MSLLNEMTDSIDQINKVPHAMAQELLSDSM